MTRSLRIGCTLMAALSAFGAPIRAQSQDSSASTPRAVSNNHAGLALALAAFTLTIAVAPPLVLPISSPDTNPELTLPHNLAALYVTGGGFGKSAPRSWTHSVMAELRHDHLQLSARHEQFNGLIPARFTTLSAGYMWHVKRVLLGGVMTGYRHTSGTRSEDAAVLALPLTMGAQVAAVRMEPAYIISRGGVTWTGRAQLEFYPRPTPLLFGLVYEAKPFYQGGPYRQAVSLLIGVRR